MVTRARFERATPSFGGSSRERGFSCDSGGLRRFALRAKVEILALAALLCLGGCGIDWPTDAEIEVNLNAAQRKRVFRHDFEDGTRCVLYRNHGLSCDFPPLELPESAAGRQREAL